MIIQHRIEPATPYRLQQCIEGLRPAHVPTGLDALDHDKVAANVLRRDGVIERAIRS